MLTTMTKKEKLCLDYAERYKKNWEYFILTADAFSAGQVSMRDETIAKLELSKKAYTEAGAYESASYIDLAISIINSVGKELIEVEHKDGQHQLLPS